MLHCNFALRRTPRSPKSGGESGERGGLHSPLSAPRHRTPASLASFAIKKSHPLLSPPHPSEEVGKGGASAGPWLQNGKETRSPLARPPENVASGFLFSPPPPPVGGFICIFKAEAVALSLSPSLYRFIFLKGGKVKDLGTQNNPPSV